MAKNLAAVVAYLAAVRDDTGQEIHLGLEPEPDCFLETTAETIAYFQEFLLRGGAEKSSASSAAAQSGRGDHPAAPRRVL